MPSPLDSVKTIVILMQENRSFDHMLGYLSLPPWNRKNVDGLSLDPAWLTKFANSYNGAKHTPFRLPDAGKKLAGDPKHDRWHIAQQLGAVAAPYPMTGFVESCPTLDPDTGKPIVMGYFTGEDLPTTHFFAENYAICDHWFSAIPTGTQPNRLMAMAGVSRLADNAKPLPVLPPQELLYDWLEARGIRWRVYHHGLPFFALMKQWIPHIATHHNFRHISWLIDDVQNESDDKFPQVIFIDPLFSDAPHVHTPNDDHAPAALTGGQMLMADIYSTLTSNQQRWANTVFAITYDEAGGFFDHVAPPACVTRDPDNQPEKDYVSFTSLGPRVPGFIISPLVEPGAVYNGVLDHTSILKFIADKFTPGQGYSPEVTARPVGSVTSVLTRAIPRPDIPLLDSVRVGFSPGVQPVDATQQAFAEALKELRAWDKDAVEERYPEMKGNF